MRPHLRYLRYVLLHKLYVFVAGVVIARTNARRFEMPRGYWIKTLWRLLIHDLSKFRPSEWRPYVAKFYGPPLDAQAATVADGRERISALAARDRAFDRAWLLHQHRNPHHWQHWILREDSGATKVLLPPAAVIDEMVADWIGAGTKILSWPMMHECVAMTVRWFAENQSKIQLRDIPRRRVIATLTMLCEDYGLVDAALAVHVAANARESITITAPLHGGLGRAESNR